MTVELSVPADKGTATCSGIASPSSPAILRGDAFAAAIERICRLPPPSCPLETLKYRRILLPGMVGGEIYFALLGLIGQALRIRGAEVTSLQCDRFLPACTMRKVDHYESACTRWCHRNSGPFARAMRLPHRWYSEFITPDEIRRCDRLCADLSIEDAFSLEYLGIPLGTHIRLSVDSFFKVGRPDTSDPVVVGKARDFARSAAYLTHVGLRAIETLRIDKVLLEDGKKVDWGVIRSVAGQKGIPVDCLRAGLRNYSIRFEHDRPGRPASLMPEWEQWKHIPLTESQEQALNEYLARRAKVPFEYRSEQWRARLDDPAEVRKLIGLPASVTGKVFALFPNVGFDAGVTGTVRAFSNPGDWVLQTVRFFAHRPDHHALIKIHPAEAHRNAQDPLVPYLLSQVSHLPPNVHIVPAEAGVAAQAVARLADWVLVYTSTVGVEAAAIGRPVINVGGGWNAGRGISYDVTSPDAYFAKLAEICAGAAQPPHPTDLARRYAYAFFFRSNIPINHYSVLDLGITSLNIRSLDDLSPGRDPAMDLICRGILRDEPMEWPPPST